MAEENFEDRSQCLVDQYNDYEVFGQDVSGKYIFIYLFIYLLKTELRQISSIFIGSQDTDYQFIYVLYPNMVKERVSIKASWKHFRSS